MPRAHRARNIDDFRAGGHRDCAATATALRPIRYRYLLEMSADRPNAVVVVDTKRSRLYVYRNDRQAPASR